MIQQGKKIPKKQIDKLKRQLKGYSLADVMKKTGKSKTWVYRVLNYKAYDEEVIEACVELRDKKKESLEKLAAKI